MEVMRVGISASQRAKLISAGYSSLSSLSSLSPSLLARDLNVSEVEALVILKAASRTSRMDHSTTRNHHLLLNGAQTAWDMLSQDSSTRITTSCADLDNILGGGVSCREVTEIGGVPGIGKTQLGIQLAVNVQIPVDCGGLGGKAVYVDTEGSFMVERALQIAGGCIEDMQKDNDFQRKDIHGDQENLLAESFLANIFHFRVCSVTEQVATINQLDKFVSEHRDVKVIVIDSVTFYFRHDFEDLALRTRILGEMALKLMKLAQKFNLAVVLLNQVGYKFADGSQQVTLALGDSWSHASTNRVILYWRGDDRYAHLDKSPSLPSATAPYSITSKGIRDVATSSKRTRLL